MSKYNFDSLLRAGVSYDDATQLRRIAMTLHRWHELECGTGNDYASWGIERDEETDKPFMVQHKHHGNYGWSVWCRDLTLRSRPMIRRKTFQSKDAALASAATIDPTREPELRQVLSRRTPVPDRENGALRRLAQIMARYPNLTHYVQGDCRGAALYILRLGDVPAGANVDSYYSRGIAVHQ